METYRTSDLTASSSAVTTLRTPAEFAAKAKSDNTRRAYQSDLRGFSAWCNRNKLSSLPAAPRVVAQYITDLANTARKPSTIRRVLSAISYVHRAQAFENPTRHPAVLEVMSGIARTKGTRKVGKKPITTDTLRSLLGWIPDDLKGARDRALLLVAFAGAFRRSELVALQVEDIEFEDRGARITILRSKGDQEGKGEVIGIPFGRTSSTCPLAALTRWLEVSGTTSGSVFRRVTVHGSIGPRPLSGRAVARIVQSCCRRAGLDPGVFGAHSLRSGFVTSAAIAGASERQISRTSRHRSVAVLRAYVRAATVFDDSAAALVGL